MSQKYFLYALFFLFGTIFCCKKKTKEISHLGTINWEVACNESARPLFEKGLLLLHSFEYPDARAAFIEAQKADTDFLLAYWGEAMTWNHPIWNAQYPTEGKEVLAKLGDTPELRLTKAKNQIQKDLLQSVEILFEDGDKYEKDAAYAEHMQALKSKYPDNHEIASFYALALLGASHDGRDAELYGKGAKIAQGIIEENPNHPGALHYLIHSYDDPDHAHLALNAANSYASVAPDASHALHMPSHIYVALGMWDDVIKSNIASWNASEERKKRMDLDNDALGYHALQWLVYGYLQKGEISKASELVDDMYTYAQDEPSARARTHWVMIRGAYLAETDAWDSELQDQNFDYDDLNISIQTMDLFSQGMRLYKQQDETGLVRTIDEIEAVYREAEKKSLVSGAAMCSGVSWNKQKASQQNLNNAKVMQLELQALLAQLEDRLEDTHTLLQRASELEGETAYAFGPPKVIKPAPELYGEFLLKQGKKQEAAKYFSETLKRAPNRRLSSIGIEAANEV